MLISQQEQLFNFAMDYCFQDQQASVNFVLAVEMLVLWRDNGYLPNNKCGDDYDIKPHVDRLNHTSHILNFC